MRQPAQMRSWIYRRDFQWSNLAEQPPAPPTLISMCRKGPVLQRPGPHGTGRLTFIMYCFCDFSSQEMATPGSHWFLTVFPGWRGGSAQTAGPEATMCFRTLLMQCLTTLILLIVLSLARMLRSTEYRLLSSLAWLQTCLEAAVLQPPPCLATTLKTTNVVLINEYIRLQFRINSAQTLSVNHV